MPFSTGKQPFVFGKFESRKWRKEEITNTITPSCLEQGRVGT